MTTAVSLVDVVPADIRLVPTEIERAPRMPALEAFEQKDCETWTSIAAASP